MDNLDLLLAQHYSPSQTQLQVSSSSIDDGQLFRGSNCSAQVQEEEASSGSSGVESASSCENLQMNASCSPDTQTELSQDEFNSHQQSIDESQESPLVEQDEYLLYQELHFANSTSGKTIISDEAQQSVQLDKILEDDDEDGFNEDDSDSLDDYQLDSTKIGAFHLSTLIEDFDSFASSPSLLRDPLIGGQQDEQVKAAEASSSQVVGSRHNSQFDFSCDHRTDLNSTVEPQTDFQCNEQQTEQQPDDRSHPSQLQDRLNNEQYKQQVDNFSEISSFQQVSDSFATHSKPDADPMLDSSLSVANNETRKRRLDFTEDTDEDEDGQEEDCNSNEKQAKSKNCKSRAKRKRTNSTTQSSSIATDNCQSQVMTAQQGAFCAQLKPIMQLRDHQEQSFDDESTSNSPHLSKYRRRTANARERIRMREINQAFEKLKKVLPVEMIQQAVSEEESDASSRRGAKSASNQQSVDSQSIKLTKITTLRFAKSYIAQLSELLNEHAAPGESPTIISRSSSAQVSQSNADQSNRSARGKSRGSSRTGSQSWRKRRISTTNSCNLPKAQQPPTGSSCKPTAELAKPTSESQLNSNQSIIIHNNVPTGLTLVPIQQQPSQRQQHQQQQPTFAYAYCNQQPIGVPQTSSQDRAFMTPVAVAILGIPAGNMRGPNEPQALQLLGIHQSNQQLQRHQNHRTSQLLDQQHKQQQTFGLINQQPVTLTLDDLNGLSALRLAATNSQQQPQTIQIQQTARPALSIQQATQIVASNSTQAYNYAAYQPSIQINQVQQTTANHRPTFNAQQVQFQAQNISNSEANQTTLTTITGSNSEYKNFAISPTMIAQHINNSNNNNNSETQQINFQQSNCSGQNLLMSNNLNLNQNPNSNHLINVSASYNQPNVIYINSPGMVAKLASSEQNCNFSRVALQTSTTSTGDFQKLRLIGGNQTTHLDRAKFEAQFEAQPSEQSCELAANASEANIRQLVASLATSIQPGEQKENSRDEQSQLDQQANNKQLQQQPKRTYRFHNYDGNMITNHLYNNVGQQQVGKRSQQQPVEQQLRGKQRSRQNSLSSTCSTTSSSCSSLVSPMSTVSPANSIMLKSPSLDQRSGEISQPSSSSASD